LEQHLAIHSRFLTFAFMTLFLLPAQCFPLGCPACIAAYKLKVVMADGTEIIGYTDWNDHWNVEYLRALIDPPKQEDSVWPIFSLEEFSREARISRIRDYIQQLPSATEEAIALGFPQNFKHWLHLKTIDITTSHQTPPDRLEVYKRIQRLPNGFNCIEKKIA
jgi:hypothetical protein